MQKGDPYTKLFSTFSEVRLIFHILSKLSTVCSSLVKPHYTKMTIRPLFIVHALRPFHAFSNVLVFIETFSRPTLCGVRMMF